jgi:hypothetical protein
MGHLNFERKKERKELERVKLSLNFFFKKRDTISSIIHRSAHLNIHIYEDGQLLIKEKTSPSVLCYAEQYTTSTAVCMFSAIKLKIIESSKN